MHGSRASLGPASARRTTLRPGTAPRPLLYRRLGQVLDAPPTAAAVEGARSAAVAAVEACLFRAAGPLGLASVARQCSQSEADAARHLGELQLLLARGQSAFQLVELAGGYQLLTRREFHPWLARRPHPARLAEQTMEPPGRMETLAVVAYHQPVTRAEIERLRGVPAADALSHLVARGFVRAAGRQASLGRPQLYATTELFLRYFGIGSLAELPPLQSPTPAPAPELIPS